MMRYRLQNILLPDAAVCNETEMYYRSQSAILLPNGTLQMPQYSVCDFSTYFNSFSAGKWREYTRIQNIVLELTLKGNFLVELCSACWNWNKVSSKTCAVEQISVPERKTVSFPFDMETTDILYFKLTSLSPDSELYGNGGYSTDIEPSNLLDVKIDLVMCTFRREKFVLRNLRLLKDEFLQNKNYQGAEHFRIKIVDNGKTLSQDIETEDGRIKLYPNINAGGSGGFARGMMESLYDGVATHILLMDDDILVQPEAFERTFNLLRLLRPEYNKSFITASMLKINQKNIQHAKEETYRGSSIHSLRQGYNLNRFRDVVLNEMPEHVPNPYAGWWFCCIPTRVAALDNLPYPFFVKIDDIEYSVRNTRHLISLNGISVWHDPFDAKYATAMDYYFAYRNWSVLNIVHGNLSAFAQLKFIFRPFAEKIFRYEYETADLLLDGLENFLKGPDFFAHVNLTNDLKEHLEKQKKTISLCELKHQEILAEDFLNCLSGQTESKMRKAFRYVTLNGHLLPSFFFRGFGHAIYGINGDARHYFMRKTVLAYGQNFTEGAFFSIDRKKCFSLLLRYIKLEITMLLKYKTLKKRYLSSFKEMISEKFWRSYLKLDEQ